ncbi:glycosyltransferase [Emticicia sp.]|uniref:glycosyltransferase n=1 Tax=Emticicia sp. TaxID=1930953 RepID=UPI003753642E
MKKIIHIVPSWPSKYRRYDCVFLYEQVKNLALRSEYQYVVIVGYPIGWYIKNKIIWFLDKPLLIDLPNVKIHYFFYPNIFRFNRFFNKIAYFIIKKYFKISIKNSANYLIHAHFLNIADFALKLAKDFKAQFFLTEHTGKFSMYKELYQFSWDEVKNILKSSNQTIVVSPSLKNTITKLTNQKIGENISVIPNGIDLAKFFPLNRNNQTAPFKLLYIGNLLETKGVKVLLDAYLLISKEKTFHLSIIGDGDLLEYCNNFILKNNLQEYVKIFGAIPNQELPQIINQNHLLLLPSYSEGFGVVVIEAVSCGTPAIATACGGPEFIINDPSLGKIIPIGDVTALAQAIENVRANYDYNTLEMHNNMKERFGWEVIAQQILKKYDSFFIKRNLNEGFLEE